MTMFYGRSTNYMFSVTKALALVPCEIDEPNARSVVIKVLKNKRCKIGTIGQRHRILIDDNLKIWQPAGEPLGADLIMEEE